MQVLRAAAFKRSEGVCECGRDECLARTAKLRMVTWCDGDLHHVRSRAHGGSDVLENVLYITRLCHQEITGVPEWSKRA